MCVRTMRPHSLLMSLLTVLGLFGVGTALADNSTYEVKTDLPVLPKGVTQAADLELTADRSIRDIEIPGYKKRMRSRGRVEFRTPSATRTASTLNEAAAEQLTRAFINEHFQTMSKRMSPPQVSKSARTVQGKRQIHAYSMKYFLCHNSIPILNAIIMVYIEGNEITRATVSAYSAREISEPGKLLTAAECLKRASGFLTRPPGIAEKIIIRRAQFGYYGGYRQHWEQSRRRDDNTPIRAAPVYLFGIQWRTNGEIWQHVFDARTAELLYPKPAKGQMSLSLPGPTLAFSRAGSRTLLLIAPRDVRIEEATFELESRSVDADWATYSVKQLFKDITQWGFTVRALTPHEGAFITLPSNKDRSSKATGTLDIAADGDYEVEVLVCQGGRGHAGRAVRISIDGQSRILGKKGPDSARIWEQWGLAKLSRGKHAIILETAPGSRGAWEVGPLRIRTRDGLVKSSPKDLQILIGTSDSPLYLWPAHEGRFVSQNMTSQLPGRASISRDFNLVPLTFISSSAGQLIVRALKISFVTGDEKVATEKAAHFLLIGPKCETAQTVSAEALIAFSRHARSVVAATEQARWRVFEALRLWRCLREMVAASKDPKVKDLTADFETKLLELAKVEASRLASVLGAYSTDFPEPDGFPKTWATVLYSYAIKLDSDRLTDRGGYLDPWGHPYILRHMPDKKRIEVVSRGPDGKDDAGKGDDITAVATCRW